MIVLDTHVLIWWVTSPQKLTPKARKLIEKERKAGKIVVSSFSIWEIYLLVKKEKLQLTIDTDSFLSRIESLPEIQFVPVNNNIAAKSVNLPEPIHADPADRIIISTAREYGAKLITSDKKILQYPHVESVW